VSAATHDRAHAHGHSHGLVDPSIVRSRAGLRAVLVSLAVLGVTAVFQALVFVLSGSVALLADLIHNAGDALTAIPVGAAFLLRSARAERWAGYAVVFAIFVSAWVALYDARPPRPPGGAHAPRSPLRRGGDRRSSRSGSSSPTR
jgi:Co/Zn/Cd efflux system component